MTEDKVQKIVPKTKLYKFNCPKCGQKMKIGSIHIAEQNKSSWAKEMMKGGRK